jgi:pimeloyl-ACP methyl ester carboxylesterase
VNGTFRTDGTTIYYERRGTGPALLMISGGGGDAAYYRGVAERLADTFTVLTYDRRGNSRSTVDDPTAPLDLAQQSADALAVLTHNDFADALVFGGSGGALISLDLAVRHRAAVVGVIAHEPPVHSLLPATAQALFAEIAEITRTEGPRAAWLRFVTTIDHADSPKLLHGRTGRRVAAAGAGAALWLARRGPAPLREVSRFVGNSEYLMLREVEAFLAFEPDYAALADVPLTVGVGATSRVYYPAVAAAGLARKLGAPVVEFPGGHTGYADKPEPFAAILRDVLDRFTHPAH